MNAVADFGMSEQSELRTTDSEPVSSFQQSFYQ